jgi:cation-transporting ATPase E
MWEKAEPHTRAGRRVILAGRADAALLSLAGPDGGPPPIVPLGIVILDDDVRDGAATTLAYFADQGVTLKLISGDNPDTVRAVAAKAGLEIVDWTSGPDLPDSDLGATVEQFQVFGRITPQQKRSLVEALRANNHHVAMTGDGVNDVLALRAADLGIALQEGTAAAQAVSSLVMLADAFPALPETVKEGRRIVHGIATVARLFLLKTFYSALITAAVVVVAVITSKSPDYPFHPRQLSMMSTYSIGIPAFWLTIANRQPDKPPLRFIAEVLRVAIPGAIVAAATALATFYGLRDIAHSDLAQVRTATALSVCVVAMTFIPCAEFAQPEGRQRRIRLAAFLAVVYSAAFPIIFALPFARKIYDVVPLTMGQWTVCLSVGVAGALLLVAVMAMVRRRWAVS